MFKRLKISDWRQFSNVDISFHPHLTVLTGANGAGKTTILNLLSQSTGWNPQFVSSYEKDKAGISKYFNSLKNIGTKNVLIAKVRSNIFLTVILNTYYQKIGMHVRIYTLSGQI